ncbi:MAG TPA: PriCT-2 domain-containing protein, partial [Coleofasciculaceae cyanobacterium]
MIAAARYPERERTSEQVRTDRLIAALSDIPAEFTLTPTARKIPIRPGWQRETLSRSELKHLLNNGGWVQREDGSSYKQHYDGLALIIPNGYVVADIDGKTAHKLFCEITGQSQPDKTVAWSSGKPHNGSLLYRLPDDLTARIEALPSVLSKLRLTECPTWKTHGTDAIELLLGGSRATLPPSAHPETQGYEFKLGWEYGIQPAPDWIVQAIASEIAKREYWAAQPQLQFTGIVGKDSIEQWLQAIDPDTLDYDAWVKVGMSIKSALPDDDGLELWDSWSQRGSKYRPGECKNRWDGFSEGRVPIAYLARLAGFELTAIGAGIGFAKPDLARTETQRNRDRLISKRMLTFRTNYKQETDLALYLSQTPEAETIWYKGWQQGDPLQPMLLAQTILIRGGIGSGKTEGLLRGIVSWGGTRQLIWITSRANLNTQTGQRAEQLGLVVYNHQDDVKLFNEMLRTKQPGIYTFCLEGMSDYHTAHIDWANAIVVIDEFSGVRGEASSANPAIFAELERCLREAGTLFALDANLSDFDLDIISLYRSGKSRMIYRQVEGKSAKKIAWAECRNKDGAISLSHDGIQFAWIEQRIQAGESFVIASDSKSALKAALLHSQKLGSAMAIATSETIEFNRQLFPMPDVVIAGETIHRFGYSPVAQSGLDIQTPFDQGLLLYCGIVPPDQALQLLGRCRNCNDWTISAPRRSLNPAVSFNALTESKITTTSANLLDSLAELNPNTSVPSVAWGNAQRMMGEVFSAF